MPDVKVLAPRELRERIREKLEDGLAAQKEERKKKRRTQPPHS